MCSNKQVAYVRVLDTTPPQKLKGLTLDFKNWVHGTQQQDMARNQVIVWLLSVETLELLVRLQAWQVSVGGCCSKDCWSSCELKIRDFAGLIEKGCFDEVAGDYLVVVPVDELPEEGTAVSFESKFDETWESFRERLLHAIIVFVGIGGMGKATLFEAT